MLKQAVNITVISAVLSASAAYGSYIVDLTDTGQGVPNETNVGLSWIVLDTNGNPIDLTLTARSHVDSNNPFDLFAAGDPGTVVFSHNGTGVQNQFGGGSTGISGGGADQNEELIFDFGIPVFGDSLSLNFSMLTLGSGLGVQDDPVIWVYFNGTIAMFDETTWGSAYTDLGGQNGTLDFAALGFSGTDLIERVVVRETNKHMLITGAEFKNVPAPGALVLLATAGLLSGRRRRTA